MPSQRECGCLRGESCSECAQPNRGQRVREALNVTVRHSTEVSVEFLRGMAARMCMSFEKYGAVRDFKGDKIASALKRIEKYQDTGNTEYLMDAANFCMMEYMYPRHTQAHFKAEDSVASPGRAQADGAFTQAANTHEQELTRSGFRYQREGD